MSKSKHQVSKLVLRSIFGLISIIVILTVLLLWRLSSSPLQLNTLTPSIQKIVSNLPGDFHIGFESIELFWNRKDKDIQLRATSVALSDHSGVPIVTTPAVDISISVPALMHRVIALSAIEVRDVDIHVLRNADGSLRLGEKVTKPGGETAKPQQKSDSSDGFHDLTEIVTHLFSALESSPDPRQPLSYLDSIDLQGALTVEDRMLLMDFGSDNIHFSFQGQENGFSGELSLLLNSPEALSGIKFDVSLLAHGKEITANMKIGGIQPSRLAGLDNRLEILKNVDLDLNATVSAAMTFPDAVKTLELNVSGGTGSIALDQFFPEPLSIRSLELKAMVDPSAKSVDLSSLNLSLGKAGSIGPSVNVSGSARSTNAGIKLDLTTVLEHLQFEELVDYWPTGVIPGTRTWLVENIKVGTLDKAKLGIKMTIPSQQDSSPTLEKLEGDLAYSDLSVFYFRPMPPATGVTGSGTFNQRGFDLSIDSGALEGIAIKSGRVQIAGLNEKQVTLDVKTSLDGEVSDALAVLESPPFRLDKVIGFGSTQSGGDLAADFSIALPLKSGLVPGEIDYHVDASLTQVSVQNIYSNISVENGDLKVLNDSSHLGIKGSLELAGIPIALNWNSNREEGGVFKTIVKTQADEIKPTNINSLGYPVDEYFTGSFAAALDIEIGTDDIIDVSINTDFNKSGLSIPQLQWSKPVGKMGKVSASVSISKGKQFKVKDFSIEAGSLTATGEASYNNVTSELSVDLVSASLGQTHMNKLGILRDPQHGTRINVGGGHLDLEPVLLSKSNQDKAEESGSVLTGHKDNESTADSTSTPGALRFDIASLDKVFFSQDRFLENVSGGLIYSDGGWQSINFKGQYPVPEENQKLIHLQDGSAPVTQGVFSFSFGPSVSGKYPLSVKVNDLGSLLATTLDNHSLSGGELSIQGDSTGVFLKAPVSVSLQLDKFTVMQVPVIAQVLSFASLDQVLKTMQSEGLAIGSFYGELVYSDEKLSSDLLRAHGGMIGATIKGSMDLDKRILDLRGGLIPFSGINRALGKIPLMNRFMGKDGQGIVSLDYAINGTIDQPEVSVNPGSLLTPGALRNIFDRSETEQQ